MKNADYKRTQQVKDESNAMTEPVSIITEDEARQKRNITIFVIASALIGMALGLSDSIFSNYFKDAYDATAQQRGFIEFPRELPGLLSVVVIAGLSFLGDLRTAIFAQILAAFGLIVLGLTRPVYGVMLLFLFIYSMGQHMYMPLADSIGLSLAKKGDMGRVLGKFNSIRMAFLMIAGLLTFFGFRFGIFSFDTPVTVFLISAFFFLMVGVMLILLYRNRATSKSESHGRIKIIWRKEYIRYYFICALYGGRKQIMIVFSPWVLIDLLGFKADSISILAVIGSFIGIFFIPVVGRFIDKVGVKKVMIVEAFAFIGVYTAYGFLSKWVNENVVVLAGVGMLAVYLLNILDRMSAQFYMTRAIFLKSILVVPEDMTPTLSLGMSIDHVVAIVGSYLCGMIWEIYGPEYVFIVAGILSVLNMVVALGIKKKPGQDGEL